MAATYEIIAQTITTSSVSDVTFSSISGSYTDLILIINAKFSTGTDLDAQLNGDTGSNYSVTRMWGTGSTAASSRNSNATSMRLDNYGYPDTTFAGINITHINNYSNTTTYKTILSRADNANNGSNLAVNLWRNTNAINSIKLFPAAVTGYTISSGSTFTLYGILKA